jgi:hypothetical protein
MNLPKEAIVEFQRIYIEEFGESLTYEKATHEASGLLELIVLINEHVHENDKDFDPVQS